MVTYEQIVEAIFDELIYIKECLNPTDETLPNPWGAFNTRKDLMGDVTHLTSEDKNIVFAWLNEIEYPLVVTAKGYELPW